MSADWDGRTYCSLQQRQILIETTVSCGNEIVVQEPVDDLKMRSMGILEEQEAVENVVAARDGVRIDFLA
jgi:hypothetical protein